MAVDYGGIPWTKGKALRTMTWVSHIDLEERLELPSRLSLSEFDLNIEFRSRTPTSNRPGSALSTLRPDGISTAE